MDIHSSIGQKSHEPLPGVGITVRQDESDRRGSWGQCLDNFPDEWTEELQQLEGAEADLLRAGGHHEAVPILLLQAPEDPVTEVKLVMGLKYHCHGP